MPTRPIQQHQAVVVGETGGGVGEEQRHRRGVDPRQDQRAEFAIEGADCGQAVDELADDLLTDDGTQGPRGPAAALIADPAETGFVLKQQTHAGLGRKPMDHFLEDLGEFFLKRF